MRTQEKVSTIMTQEVLTVDINDPLTKVSELFNSNKLRHLPVVSKNKLVGIISHTDILRISFGNTFEDDQLDADEAIFDMLSINQIMKHSPFSVTVDQTITEVAEILSEKQFHALPVVKNNKLVGIVTTTDLIRYFLREE